MPISATCKRQNEQIFQKLRWRNEISLSDRRVQRSYVANIYFLQGRLYILGAKKRDKRTFWSSSALFLIPFACM